MYIHTYIMKPFFPHLPAVVAWQTVLLLLSLPSSLPPPPSLHPSLARSLAPFSVLAGFPSSSLLLLLPSTPLFSMYIVVVVVASECTAGRTSGTGIENYSIWG